MVNPINSAPQSAGSLFWSESPNKEVDNAIKRITVQLREVASREPSFELMMTPGVKTRHNRQPSTVFRYGGYEVKSPIKSQNKNSSLFTYLSGIVKKAKDEQNLIEGRTEVRFIESNRAPSPSTSSEERPSPPVSPGKRPADAAASHSTHNDFAASSSQGQALPKSLESVPPTPGPNDSNGRSSSSAEESQNSSSTSLFADAHPQVLGDSSPAKEAVRVDDAAKKVLTPSSTAAASSSESATPPAVPSQTSPLSGQVRTPSPDRRMTPPPRPFVLPTDSANTPIVTKAAGQPLPPSGKPEDDSLYEDDHVSNGGASSSGDLSMKNVGDSSFESTPASSPVLKKATLSLVANGTSASSAAAAAASSSSVGSADALSLANAAANSALESLKTLSSAATAAASSTVLPSAAPAASPPTSPAPSAPSSPADKVSPSRAAAASSAREPAGAEEEPRVIEARPLRDRIVRINKPLWIATSVLSALGVAVSAVTAAAIAFGVQTPFLVSAVAFLGGSALAVPLVVCGGIISLATLVSSWIKIQKRSVPAAH